MKSQPIKRNAALIPLSREHHTDLLLVWKIRQGLKKGVEASRIGAYVQYMNAALIQDHFHTEETYLFDPVNPADELVAQAREHHRDLRQLVDYCAPTNHPEPQKLEQLANLLEVHVRFEERTLFPHLEKVLTARQLQTLQHMQDGEEETFQEHWEDAFWQ